MRMIRRFAVLAVAVVLVQPLVGAGQLVEVRFGNMGNQLRLWVDVVWQNDRPLGLGAQRFIELMRQATREAGEGPGLG